MTARNLSSIYHVHVPSTLLSTTFILSYLTHIITQEGWTVIPVLQLRGQIRRGVNNCPKVTYAAKRELRWKPKSAWGESSHCPTWQTACRQCGCHQCREHGWLNKVGVHSTEYKHTRRIHGELHKKSHGLLNPAYGTGAFLTVSSRMWFIIIPILQMRKTKIKGLNDSSKPHHINSIKSSFEW